MVIFPLAPDQTIAQMWSNGARGGTVHNVTDDRQMTTTDATLYSISATVLITVG